MARRRGRGVRAARGTAWVLMSLAVLALADLVLVWVALSPTRADAVATGASETVTAPSPGGVAATAGPASAPTTTPAPAVTDVGVVLAAVDDATAYRATTGSCPQTAALIEATTDGGVDWVAATPADARSIQAISASAEQVSIIAADPASCAPAAYTSFVGGAEWESADQLATSWYLDGGRVVSPAGVPPSPCEHPVQLVGRSSAEAAVLCSDATVSTTTDAGAAWQTSAPMRGVVSVASVPDGYVVAVVGLDGCAGAQVLALATDLSAGAPGACVPAEAAPGATVIASAPSGVLWFWSGEVVARSSDGGATWSR